MVSFVIQSVIPLLFLLSLPWLDRRKVLLAWPLTHVMDLDYVVGHHRATLHNVWVLLPFLAVLLWSLRPATRDPGRAQWMTICLVYLASHLTMDVFAGGITLFYPLSEFTLCWFAAIDVVTATNTPIVYFEPCSFTGIPVVSEVYAWLSWNEAAFLAFLLPAWAGALVYHLATRRKRRACDANGTPPGAER